MRRRRLSELQVGLLTLGLIVVLIYFAFTRVNPFANPYELRASFRDARSIGNGAPVRMAGVEVGEVSRLEANGEGSATVTMKLRDDALPLHQDARLRIRPRILLEGNYFVDLQPGTPSVPELRDGSTVPVTQTSTSVSLPEVLALLTTDTRTDLRTLLEEYGTKGLGHGAAEAVNRTIPHLSPAYRGRRSPMRLCSGSSRTGIFRACCEASRGPPARWPAIRRRSRRSSPTSMWWRERWPARTPRWRRRCPPSGTRCGSDTRPWRRGRRPAEPSRLLMEALPGVRSTAPTLDVGIPWIAQARALVRPAELRGLAADLRRAVPSLVKLNERLVPLNGQLRALSSCTNTCSSLRRVHDPEHRDRELRSGGAEPDLPQLRGPGG